MTIPEKVALQRQAEDKARLSRQQAASAPLFDRNELNSRKERLSALDREIVKREDDILEALRLDLGKGEVEAAMAEVSQVRGEIKMISRKLSCWMRPRRVRPSLAQFPARAFILPEPLGLCLIMSPWNYPFLLTMAPLVGALAAGNRVIVKPSKDSPNTSKIIEEIVEAAFAPEWVQVVTGGRVENQALLDQKFDHIFFTGSAAVGRVVMEKAARYLTPVTLELGGKSPCIVTRDADLALAARRIAFGKGINAGQTCVAPDYVLAQEEIAKPLIAELKAAFTAQYGEDATENPLFPHIINAKHYERMAGLLDKQPIAFGGQMANGRLSPTVLYPVDPASPVMQEEIFGPILPVIPYKTLPDALHFVSQRPKPLAFYIFTQDKGEQALALSTCSFGGSCVNDCVMHLANPRLPFGGVGDSGMGRYHGRASFDTFSHKKSVLVKNRVDWLFRYPPYTDEKRFILRRMLK